MSRGNLADRVFRKRKLDDLAMWETCRVAQNYQVQINLSNIKENMTAVNSRLILKLVFHNIEKDRRKYFVILTIEKLAPEEKNVSDRTFRDKEIHIAFSE